MNFEFGDLVLVPFPFTDQTSSKKRPAVVISSSDYQLHRSDLIVIAVTSQLRPAPLFGELVIAEWQKAGLVKPSVIKPVVATIHKKLVLSKRGKLLQADLEALRALLQRILR
jgi:mRNA interferase MazF